MPSERGEYRAIRRVLLDGKDFQKLSERARSLFLFIKIGMGPSGIDVAYPGALEAQLAGQTGQPLSAIARGLQELVDAGWIQREKNVLWVVDQLRHEPHMKAANQNHRQKMCEHVQSLPRLPIVRRFVDHYPDFFGTQEQESTDTMGDGMGDGIPHTPAITEEGERKTIRKTIRKREEREGRETAKRWRVCPEGWQPNEHHHQLAEEFGLDLGLEVAKFRDYEFEKPKSDPDRTFANWLRNAMQFNRGSARPQTQDDADKKVIALRRSLDTIDYTGTGS